MNSEHGQNKTLGDIKALLSIIKNELIKIRKIIEESSDKKESSINMKDKK